MGCSVWVSMCCCWVRIGLRDRRRIMSWVCLGLVVAVVVVEVVMVVLL